MEPWYSTRFCKQKEGFPGPVAGYLLRANDGRWTIEGDPEPYSYDTPEQAAEALLLRGKRQWMRYKNFEMTILPHAGAWVGWVQDTHSITAIGCCQNGWTGRRWVK